MLSLRSRPLATAALIAAALAAPSAPEAGAEALRLAQQSLVYSCATPRGTCPLTYPQVEGSACRCTIDGQWVSGTAR
ncbi:MAG: hypothetical protein R6V44_08705 [Paracoccaceae bacterium]